VTTCKYEMERLKIQELLNKDLLFVNPPEFCHIHSNFILPILLSADEYCHTTENTLRYEPIQRHA